MSYNPKMCTRLHLISSAIPAPSVPLLIARDFELDNRLEHQCNTAVGRLDMAVWMHGVGVLFDLHI